MTRAGPDFSSRGHLDDEWTATILRADDPACTLWVEELRHGDDAPSVIMAVESPKDLSPPAFVVAAPDGSILRKGQLNDCVGCHGAVHDGVFSLGDPADAGTTSTR